MTIAYKHECILLGMVLQYGDKAAQVALPLLTADKFVFGFNGGFGTEHSAVWSLIHKTYMQAKKPPVFANIATDRNATELTAIIKRLKDQYHIYSFDQKLVETLVADVDKAGVVHDLATKSQQLAMLTQNEAAFDTTVASIQDIEQWASQQLDVLRQTLSIQSEGYTDIKLLIEQRKRDWQLAAQGQNLAMLPNGLPTLMKNKLIPKETITVLHGVSGTGKSTLAMQLALGVAMGLKINNVPGCVAINSLEMTQSSLIDVLASTLAKVDTSKFLDGSVTPEEVKKLELWADVVAELPIFIDDTSFITTTAMQYRASGLSVSPYGPVRMLVSDYGELFKDNGATEEQRVNSVFREQFGLSRLLGAAVLAISQSTQPAGTNTYIAGADGTRYSRGVLQATDILLELYNPAAIKAGGRTVVVPESFQHGDSCAYLMIEKYRNAKTGGILPLGWRGEHTAFWDMGIHQVPDHEEYFSHTANLLKALGHDPLDYGYKPQLSSGGW